MHHQYAYQVFSAQDRQLSPATYRNPIAAAWTPLPGYYRVIFLVVGAFLFVAGGAAALVAASTFRVLLAQKVHQLATPRLS